MTKAHSNFSMAVFSVWIWVFSWLPSLVVTDAAMTCRCSAEATACKRWQVSMFRQIHAFRM